MTDALLSALPLLSGTRTLDTQPLTGTKVRKPSAQLQKLFPILAKPANAQFSKVATGFTYTTETIFTIFSALVILQLFISNPRWIIALHSSRVLALLTIAILSAYSIYQGHSVPEVHISFYLAELFVVLGVNIAVLIINSIRLAEKRRNPNATVSSADVIGLVVPAGFTIFNALLIAQQFYRLRLGKRSTPVSQVFTLGMSALLSVMSINSIRSTIATMKGVP